MPDWVAISDKEGGEAEEISAEEDGSLKLESITKIHKNVVTLKYRGPSEAWRIVRCVGGVLSPPEKYGWGDHTYITVKRKLEDSEVARKRFRIGEEEHECAYYDSVNPGGKKNYTVLCNYLPTDLQPIPVERFEETFARFGSIKVAKATKEPQNNRSGAVYITYEDLSVPLNLYGRQDIDIDGVKIEVSEPGSEDKERRKVVMTFERGKEEVCKHELREFFEQFGRVTDIHIPTPFKNFGFITFARWVLLV